MSPPETAEVPVLVKTSPISKWTPIAQDTREEVPTTAEKEVEATVTDDMADHTTPPCLTVEETVTEEAPSSTSTPKVTPELPPKIPTPEVEAELQSEPETSTSELPQAQDSVTSTTSNPSTLLSDLRAFLQTHRLLEAYMEKGSTRTRSSRSRRDTLLEFSASEESDGSSSSSSLFPSSSSSGSSSWRAIIPGTGPFHLGRSGWVPDHPQIRLLQRPHIPITNQAPSPGPIPYHPRAIIPGVNGLRDLSNGRLRVYPHMLPTHRPQTPITHRVPSPRPILYNPPPIVLTGNPLLSPLSQRVPIFPPAPPRPYTPETSTGPRAIPYPPVHTPLLPRTTSSSPKDPDYWIFGPRYGVPQGPFLHYYGSDDDGVDVYLDSSNDFDGVGRQLLTKQEDGERIGFSREEEEEEEIPIFYNPYDKYHCEIVQQSGSPPELLNFNHIWDEGFKDALRKGWSEGYAAGHASAYNQGWLTQSVDFVEGFMSTRAQTMTRRTDRAPIGSYPKGYLTAQEVYDEGWEDGYRKRWFEGWDSGRRVGSKDREEREQIDHPTWRSQTSASASASTQMMDYESNEDDVSLASTMRQDYNDDDTQTVTSKQSMSTLDYAAKAVPGGWEAYNRLIAAAACLADELDKRSKSPTPRQIFYDRILGEYISYPPKAPHGTVLDPSTGRFVSESHAAHGPVAPRTSPEFLKNARAVGGGAYVSANPLMPYPSEAYENEGSPKSGFRDYDWTRQDMNRWGKSYFGGGRGGLVSD